MKKRGMIFIDGSNVYYDWQRLNRTKPLDIQKYVAVVQNLYPDVEFVRSYYFATETSSNSTFIHSIRKIPYLDVVTGRLQSKEISLDKLGVQCPSCGRNLFGHASTQVDKGTDINIAVEILTHAFNDSFDLAILASRDSDFVSVVKVVKHLGKNIEAVLFENAQHNALELTESVDNVCLIHATEYANCER